MAARSYYNDSYQKAQPQYEDFIATRMYCPNCRAAMPVREKLLLILPAGELHEYICVNCGEVLGDKKVNK